MLVKVLASLIKKIITTFILSLAFARNITAINYKPLILTDCQLAKFYVLNTKITYGCYFYVLHKANTKVEVKEYHIERRSKEIPLVAFTIFSC